MTATICERNAVLRRLFAFGGFLVQLVGRFIHSDYFDYWGKGTSVVVTPEEQKAPQVLFPVRQCSKCSQSITIGCLASNLTGPDATFKWFDPDGKELNTFIKYPAVSSGGSYTLVSHLQVNPCGWSDTKSYKCQVKNSIGDKEETVNKPDSTSDQFSLKISSPDAKELFTDGRNDTTIQCGLTGSEKEVKMDVSWTFGGQEKTNSTINGQVKPNGVKSTRHSNLTLSKSDYFSGKEVKCSACCKSAKFSFKNGTEPSVRIYKSDELDKNNFINLVCEVSSEQPGHVAVKWKVGDQKPPVDGNYTTFMNRSDGSTFFLSYLIVPSTNYEKSVIKCAVYHAAMKNNQPTVASTSATVPKKSEETGTDVLLCSNEKEDLGEDEDEISSLWSTASSFIFLFLFSLVYSIVLSLTKIKS